MKKPLGFLSALLTVLLLFIGCTGKEIEENQIKMDILTIEDYYPFMKNIKMQYIGVNNEFSQMMTFIEFMKDNRVQIKIRYEDRPKVKVLEYENGELREIYSEDQFYHIENMLNVNSEMRDILLKEPLEIGSSWETIDGYKRSITGIDVEIDLPYGNLKALEVTTQLGEGKIQRDYYVKNIGYVGTIYIESGFEIKTLLEKVDKEPLKTSLRFYYPTLTDINTVYVDKEIEIETNTDIIGILEYNMQNPEHENLLPSISENANINFIKLDRGEKIVKVDFSSDLVQDMNSESALEIEILRSIVNTIGNYYNVENVHISIDGEPYSSEYFSLREDEFFMVDYNGVEEFKEDLN